MLSIFSRVAEHVRTQGKASKSNQTGSPGRRQARLGDFIPPPGSAYSQVTHDFLCNKGCQTSTCFGPPWFKTLLPHQVSPVLANNFSPSTAKITQLRLLVTASRHALCSSHVHALLLSLVLATRHQSSCCRGTAAEEAVALSNKVPRVCQHSAEADGSRKMI